MTVDQIDQHPHFAISIARVFFEGHTKEDEEILVAQLFLTDMRDNTLNNLYIRTVGSRDILSVGAQVIFGSKNTYVNRYMMPIKIKQVGPTFKDYDCPGKIIKGG